MTPRSVAKKVRQQSLGVEPELRALLDHIAVELAHEYVRLMEEAASEEVEAARRSLFSEGGTA